MDTKIGQLRAALQRGDEMGALRIAARFPRLGDHRARIQRGWGAYNTPDFYRQLGFDPAVLVADGISAIKERYDG